MTDDRSESLRMIRDSAAGLAHLGRRGLRRIRALRFTEPGFDRDVWRQMCEMGWPGLLVSEELGGSGLGVQEFCALTEELGASLVPEPLIPAAFAAMLLPADHLEPVLSGERIVLPAWQEKPHSISLIGDCALSDGRLHGRKMFVAMAAGADAFLVTVAGGLAMVERDAAVGPCGFDTGSGWRQFRHGDVRWGAGSVHRRQCERGAGGRGIGHQCVSSGCHGPGVRDYVGALEDPGTVRQEDRLVPCVAAPVSGFANSIGVDTSGGGSAAADDGYRHGSARAPGGGVGGPRLARPRRRCVVTRGCIRLHGGIGYTDAADPGVVSAQDDGAGAQYLDRRRCIARAIRQWRRIWLRIDATPYKPVSGKAAGASVIPGLVMINGSDRHDADRWHGIICGYP